MNLITASLRSTCEHLGCSISHLADRAGIHRSALSRILNGKDEMSTNLLAKLMEVETINDEDASSLAEDWTLDHWPARAKALLMIRRRVSNTEEHFGSAEPFGVAERDEAIRSALGTDELDLTIAALRQKARGNPALARALRNLNRTLDGHIDVVD
jgi:transcriptional regulator with XRE-family HTH domain